MEIIVALTPLIFARGIIMTTDLESLFSKVANLPQAQRAQAIKGAVSALPDEQKRELAQALSVGNPDLTTTNKVWLIIILTFAFALVASVLVLGIGVFKEPVANGVEPDMILTIFTTTTAFLAGLFAPSPVEKKAGD